MQSETQEDLIKGTIVPYFIKKMIEKQKIHELAEAAATEELSNKDIYIVEININSGNNISVLIDNFKGVSINDCSLISRAIEKGFNREKEDFGLTVSSPGLSTPFKIHRQYAKYIGKEIEVFTTDNKKLKLKLISVNKNGIKAEDQKNIKIEGKKKKQQIKIYLNLTFEQIKTAKPVISFK